MTFGKRGLSRTPSSSGLTIWERTALMPDFLRIGHILFSWDRRRGREPSYELYKPALPRVRSFVVDDLKRQMILKWLRATRLNPGNCFCDAVFQRDGRFISKKRTCFFCRTSGVFYLLGTWRNIDRLKLEVQYVGNGASNVIHGDKLLIGPDIYRVSRSMFFKSKFFQGLNGISHEPKTPLLLAISLNNRLFSLEHPVYHDGYNVSVWIVILLARAENIVGHGARRHVLAENPALAALVAVARHAGTKNDTLDIV